MVVNSTGTKSKELIEDIVNNNRTCAIPGCCELITIFTGPGSNLCYAHQEKHRDNGGMGMPDRPYTFHRERTCACCGYCPDDDPEIQAIEDLEHRERVSRGMMHADHLELKSISGDHSEINIETKCAMCHTKKTLIQKDYLGKNK
jgi:hypothetical protein